MSKQTTKAEVAKVEKKAITPEVMSNNPLAKNMTEEQVAQVKLMLGQVCQDLANAELGKFYALRAGIGLKAIKGQFEHGGWEPFLAATFPGKSQRTIQRYMKNAEVFFVKYNLTSDKAWAQMFEMDGKLLDRAASQLLISDGKDGLERIPSKEIPKVVKQMAEFISEEGAPATAGGRQPEEPRPLSSRERLQAVTDLYNGLRSKLTQEVVAQRSWTVLPVEDQEGIAASLRTASEEIMRNVRKVRQSEDKK
jgi:hypothetical protein